MVRNILGASQSGFIDSVGFEMYSQLEEAIAKKQGKSQARRRKSNAEINLQIDAYLPSEYIDDERQKSRFTNVSVKLIVLKITKVYKMN